LINDLLHKWAAFGSLPPLGVAYIGAFLHLVSFNAAQEREPGAFLHLVSFIAAEEREPGAFLHLVSFNAAQ
jgi:hypothetical protein